jgi:hypothetical protein
MQTFIHANINARGTNHELLLGGKIQIIQCDRKPQKMKSAVKEKINEKHSNCDTHWDARW